MVAKPELDPRGLKRICADCGNRFYDLNKRPIICPSCEVEFTGETKVKARRGRSPAANDPAESQVSGKTVNDEEDDTPIMEDDDDTVSLNDLDEDDDSDDDDDIDLDLDDDLGDLDDLEPDADDLEEFEDPNSSDDDDK